MHISSVFSSIKSRLNFKSPNNSCGLPSQEKDKASVNFMIYPSLFLGIAAVIIMEFGFSLGRVLLWVMACLAFGMVLGFLFGIPKSGNKNTVTADPTKPASSNTPGSLNGYAIRPNTNLEEVSDWLTKIIVGLSLVHLTTIEGKIIKISHYVAFSVNPKPDLMDKSIALALVIGFTIVGFLMGYLYTRIFLQVIISDYDQKLNKVIHIALKTAPDAPLPAPGTPSTPTTSDLKFANNILQAMPANNPEAISTPLNNLVNDYEKVRRDLPSSIERTKIMSSIATGIRRIGLAASSFLPALTKSNSPGERLAAVCILQMDFNPDYIEWLAERLVNEPPFCAYQAASALYSRMALVGAQEKKRIIDAVINAKEKIVAEHIPPDEGRDTLMEKIISPSL